MRPIAEIIMKGTAKLGGLTLPDLKTYYKAVVIKTMFYWCKDRYINGLELRIQKETLAFMTSLLLKKIPRHFTGERIIFSTNSARTTGYL